MDYERRDKILQYACKYVPFYRNIADITHKFEDFPIICKDQILNFEVDFLSEEYKNSFLSNRLISKRTSGSTGKCLNIYWDIKDDILSNMEAWRWREKWYGVSIKDRYATFHTTRYGANRLIYDSSEMIKYDKKISFNKTLISKKTIPIFLKQMEEFGITFLLTQPSILSLILVYADSEGINFLNRLKYIELVGEFLATSTYNLFKRSLPNVNIANMYGTTETGYIALTCPNGHMHLINNNVFIEVLDEQNQSTVFDQYGKIILTSLRNRAMPIIRYDIGDYGMLERKKCDCEGSEYCLKILLGRSCDTIVLPDGTQKNCYSLWYPIEKINDEFGKTILQYHFVQESPYRIVLYLTINMHLQKWRSAIEKELITSLKQYVSNDIDYSIVINPDHLYKEKNKLNFFTRSFSYEQ